MAVPAEVGGGVLQVDAAVLQTINELRAGPPDDPDYPKLPPLDRDELQDWRRCGSRPPAVPRTSPSPPRSAAPTQWNPGEDRGEQATCTDRIDHAVGFQWWGSRVGHNSRRGLGVHPRVVRLDNGGCAFLTLESESADPTGTFDLSGKWNGTAVLIGGDNIEDVEAGRVAYPITLVQWQRGAGFTRGLFLAS